MSTFYNPKYVRSRFVVLTDVDGTPTIDVFASKVREILERIKGYSTYTFSNMDKLVTISYRAYGTTSLWWLILVFNGFIHPYDIEPGTVIKIPDLFEITKAIADIVNASKIGEVVEL